MKMRRLLLCVFLSLALVVTFIPVISFAEVVGEGEADEAQSVEESIVEDASEAVTEDAINEVTENAEEEQGTFHAAMYEEEFAKGGTLPMYTPITETAVGDKYYDELYEEWYEEWTVDRYYTFTPTVSGDYRIKSESNNNINQCVDYYVKNSEGKFEYTDYAEGTTINRVVTLEAGKTYGFNYYCLYQDKAFTFTHTFGLANPTVSVKSSTLPFKKKQGIDAAANLDLSVGDYVTGVTSSNPKVMTVSGTGLKATKKTGKAVVTITLASGLTTSYAVKVQKGKVKGKVYLGCPTKVTLTVGQTLDINAVKLPVTCKNGIKYKSNKKKIASVSKSGTIVAKKKGKAKITVKVGSKKKTIKVTVL